VCIFLYFLRRRGLFRLPRSYRDVVVCRRDPPAVGSAMVRTYGSELSMNQTGFLLSCTQSCGPFHADQSYIAFVAILNTPPLCSKLLFSPILLVSDTARDQLGEKQLSLPCTVRRSETAHPFPVVMGAGEHRGSDQTLIF